MQIDRSSFDQLERQAQRMIKRQALTREQQESVKRKWLQDNNSMSFLSFRRSVVVNAGIGSDNFAAVRWSGMWLAIERDGYTHS